jgi:hypothetical protein
MESTQWLSNNEGMVDGWYGSGMASLIVLTIQKRLLVLAGVFGGWATGKFTSENQPGLLTNLSLRPSLNQLSEWCLLRALLDECLVGRQHYFSCSGRAGLITLTIWIVSDSVPSFGDLLFRKHPLFWLCRIVFIHFLLLLFRPPPFGQHWLNERKFRQRWGHTYSHTLKVLYYPSFGEELHVLPWHRWPNNKVESILNLTHFRFSGKGSSL